MPSSVTRRTALAVAAASLLAACARPQTLFPYTPAAGVNSATEAVKVRNLVIVAKPGATTGFLSGALDGVANTGLARVSGVPIKSNGTDGTPLVVTGGTSISVPQGVMVQLADEPSITVSSPDLRAGLTARLTLDFTNGGPITILVPVVDADHADFATLRPKS